MEYIFFKEVNLTTLCLTLFYDISIVIESSYGNLQNVIFRASYTTVFTNVNVYIDFLYLGEFHQRAAGHRVASEHTCLPQSELQRVSGSYLKTI